MKYIRNGFELSPSDAGYYDALNGYGYKNTSKVNSKAFLEYFNGYKIGIKNSKATELRIH